MTTVSSRVFSANPLHYFDLALKESVAVKRGKTIIRLMPEPLKSKNTIDPEDPYWDNPRNVAALHEYDKRKAEGKVKFTVLTPEKQKEWFGDL
jgi:hypothetical protein